MYSLCPYNRRFLTGLWYNIGRLVVHLVFFHCIFVFDPNTSTPLWCNDAFIRRSSFYIRLGRWYKNTIDCSFYHECTIYLCLLLHIADGRIGASWKILGVSDEMYEQGQYQYYRYEMRNRLFSLFDRNYVLKYTVCRGKNTTEMFLLTTLLFNMITSFHIVPLIQWVSVDLTFDKRRSKIVVQSVQETTSGDIYRVSRSLLA